MTSSRKNKTLYIDKEAASALELVKCGLLKPLNGLMTKKEKQAVLNSGLIDGKTFPLPFILAPSGTKNEQTIQSLQKGEEITILCEGDEFATLIVDEVFQTDPNIRTKHLFGTDDVTHPGVKTTIQRLGSWAVSGEYKLLDTTSNQNWKNRRKHD